MAVTEFFKTVRLAFSSREGAPGRSVLGLLLATAWAQGSSGRQDGPAASLRRKDSARATCRRRGCPVRHTQLPAHPGNSGEAECHPCARREARTPSTRGRA